MKFVSFNHTPVPEPREGGERELVGVLEENFRKLALTLSGIGSDLSFLSSGFSIPLKAAETLAKGDLCYLNTSGKMAKTSASTSATCASLLGYAQQPMATDATAEFIIKGIIENTGTAGDILYVDSTSGQWTATPPTASGIIRVVGYQISDSQMYFDPSQSWYEIGA
jgi:hypothetical protein